ncbi:MAG: site-2 protease family protein [Chthonomonadetes bacterium]|nr:site-2 protease family protein [Chthonomonadetes bacterium]
MRWSWKLGEYAGIAVYVHATFLLLIGWIALLHWIQLGTLQAVISGVVFILLLFGCVLLHEFGHALTAKRYGIRTRDITLLPIGGVARLEKMPDKPVQELWVALAGPAVNVVLFIALYLFLQAKTALMGYLQVETGMVRGSLWERLMVVNLFLAAFNMLPAFPMDGGRVVRALLAMRMDYVQATNIAAGLGQGMALLFGLLGLLFNPFLLFIALFVWIGAAQEASMVQIQSALGGIPVQRVMLTDFRTVSPDDPLERVVELILNGWQQDFPVVQGGRVMGVLTRSDLINALAQQGLDRLVRDVMQSEFEMVDAAEMLENVLPRLQACACHSMPVMRGSELVGLLTMDNVGEFMLIQSALNAASRRASRQGIV